MHDERTPIWRRRTLVASAVGLLLTLLAWLFWPDGKVATAKALQKELFSPESRNLTADQRREKFQALRKVTQSLSPAQREVLSADSRKRRQAEMARYFKMSARDRQNYLDQQIRREQEMQKKMAARSAGSRTGNGTGGRGTGPNALGASRPGGPGGSRDRSPQSRDDLRRQFLDSSTPAERAQRAQFMKEMNSRRAQLGLPPGGGGRGGSPR